MKPRNIQKTGQIIQFPLSRITTNSLYELVFSHLLNFTLTASKVKELNQTTARQVLPVWLGIKGFLKVTCDGDTSLKNIYSFYNGVHPFPNTLKESLISWCINVQDYFTVSIIDMLIDDMEKCIKECLESSYEKQRV